MNIPSAIQNRNLLSFNYDGYSRTVEPHTYGIDGKGHHAIRAYQVAGGVTLANTLDGRYSMSTRCALYQSCHSNSQALDPDTSEVTKPSPPYWLSFSPAAVTWPGLKCRLVVC